VANPSKIRLSCKQKGGRNSVPLFCSHNAAYVVFEKRSISRNRTVSPACSFVCDALNAPIVRYAGHWSDGHGDWGTADYRTDADKEDAAQVEPKQVWHTVANQDCLRVL
jgi:hypothetical protein